MFDIQALICHFIRKDKAKEAGTNYYCNFYGHAFDSMKEHCEDCPLYNMLIEKNLEMFNNAN